jgi:SAM-dependent methyltransferase
MVATQSIAVHPHNLEQFRAWDGEEGSYWARHAATFERAVVRYDQAFLAAAQIAPADRVLDVGCGTGATTRAAARLASAGSVVGVDLSSAMLAVAERSAEAFGNVRFLQADAQIHPFDEGSFDVVISRTGAMFFGDPADAFANLGRALRPDGRLVLLVWQGPDRNEWIAEITAALAAGRQLPAPPPDAPHPFALADPGRVRALLVAAGFEDVEVAGQAEPMWFGPDAQHAYDFIAGLLGWMLEGLDEPQREAALAQLRRVMQQHEGPDGVLFGSACWLVTALRPAAAGRGDR